MVLVFSAIILLCVIAFAKKEAAFCFTLLCSSDLVSSRSSVSSWLLAASYSVPSLSNPLVTAVWQ